MLIWQPTREADSNKRAKNTKNCCCQRENCHKKRPKKTERFWETYI